MAVATLDTLKYSKVLRAAGIPEEQADAQVSVVADMVQIATKDVATKDDLKVAIDAFRQDMRAGHDAIRHEMKEMEQRLAAKIETGDLKLSGQINSLRVEIGYLKWVVGFAVVGIFMTLIRIFLFKSPLL